jgi:hypothetical protein
MMWSRKFYTKSKTDRVKMKTRGYLTAYKVKRSVSLISALSLWTNWSSINDVAEFWTNFDTPAYAFYSCCHKILESLPLRLWRHLWTILKTLKNSFRVIIIDSCNTTDSMRKTTICRIEPYIRLVVYRIFTV